MQKRNKMCPFCYIRQLFAPKIETGAEHPVYENGVRTTPLMGWSSWNTFRNNIDHDLIMDTARALKESGLYEAGYRYINLDDNWHSNMRDENGEWQGDLVRFPDGIPAVIRELNDMGIKAGLYSSNGTLTCEDLPASLGRERSISSTISVTTSPCRAMRRWSMPSRSRLSAAARRRTIRCPTPFCAGSRAG